MSIAIVQTQVHHQITYKYRMHLTPPHITIATRRTLEALPIHLDVGAVYEHRILTSVVQVRLVIFTLRQHIHLRQQALCFRRTAPALLQRAVQTLRKPTRPLDFVKYEINEILPSFVNLRSVKSNSTFHA